MPMRTLIIEDEAPARNLLRELLAREADVEIVGEAGSAEEGANLLRRTRPDLLFLDIKLPDGDGFQLLADAGADTPSLTVFVTAFDEYAVRAFDMNAVDYLLKPFDEERFERAMRRARSHLQSGALDELRAQMADVVRRLGGQMLGDRIPVKQEGRIRFVKCEEIDWIEADGNYVRLHVGKETYVQRQTLTSIETRLDPAAFLRIHRSVIVNTASIATLQPWYTGEYVLTLNSGKELTVSRGYRHRLRSILGELAADQP